MRILVLLLLSFNLMAAGTNVTGNISSLVKRPANSVAVYISGYDDATAARGSIAFCDKLEINCLSVNYNYPAIDGFTTQQIIQNLKELNYETVLVVHYVNQSNKDVKFMDTRQTQHSGTLRNTGGNNYQYQGTSKETGSELYMNQRTIIHNVTLIDIATDRPIFDGKVSTTRGGILSGDTGMLKAAMKKLSKHLKKNKLVK